MKDEVPIFSISKPKKPKTSNLEPKNKIIKMISKPKKPKNPRTF